MYKTFAKEGTRRSRRNKWSSVSTVFPFLKEKFCTKALISFINSHPHQSRAYLTRSSLMSWFPYKSSIDRLQISL